LQNTVIFKELQINTLSYIAVCRQQIMYSEADELRLLPKDKAV
jgi:hypothetical protein